MMIGGLQCEFITIGAESEHAAARDVTEITFVSKLFPGKRIAEMNLDKRNLNRQEGITQCNAGVRKATRIQDDKVDPVASGLLHAIDEFMFGVALETDKVMSELFGNGNAAILDVSEACRAVDVRFS